ncbi:MAG TPA: RHS repeat-associated core domain-containing protein [Solirubrobacterales bacterium]
MDRKLKTPALIATLTVALGIAALYAAPAPAAVWTIEGKTLTELGLKEESVASTAAPFTIEVPKLLLKVECEVEKGSGKIISPSSDEATMELSKCKVVEPKTCAVSEPIVIKAKTELLKKAGIVYDVLKPLMGEVFGTLILKNETCALPKELKLTGSTAGQLGLEEIAKQPLKFSKAIAEAAATSMLAGASPAYFAGTSNRELSGTHKAAKWGVCALCGLLVFAAEEGYGSGNPAEPNVIRSFEGAQINLATGNLVETQTDLTTGGRKPALGLSRYYNSQLAVGAKTPGPFGYGWTSSYSANLVVDEKADTVTVRNDNGSTVVFYLVEGKYQAASWVQAKLVKESTNYVYTLPNQLKMTFNSAGQLTKETDRHGNAITLAYNGKSQLETATDGAGRKLTFAYNAGGQVESVKDPMGHLAKYTYESSNLASVSLPEEKLRWKFGYDASHQMTGLTDGLSHTASMEYDASHRATSQKDPLEHKLSVEYTETGGIKEATVTEPNTSKTVEKFNEAGEPTSVTKASGTALTATTTSEYGKSFEVSAITDPNKHTTKYGYDGEGNRTSETDANSNETKWTFNTTHDIKTTTTPKGETTTVIRNTAGDPETIERPAPGATTQKTTYKYAANGDLESETDPLSRTTTYEYDTYGDRKSVTDAEGDKRTWTYNEDSQPITEVSPRGNEEGAEASKFETKTERDAQGRPLTVTDPLGHTTKSAYDANGNLELQTDSNGHTTVYTYDADNRPIKVKRPSGATTETAYDSMGEIISRTDGNAHTTKYERNLRGEITEEIDPLGRKTVKEYDLVGNLEKVKDPEGRTTTYTYDSGDRLTKVSYSAEATHTVTYEYDKDGNTTEMTDVTGTTKKTYDELDRLTEVTNGNKEVVKYEYNLDEEPTKITYPNTKSVTQTYDKAGRLEKVTDWLGGETKFVYNRDSLLKTTSFPAASENKDEYEYNVVGQLSKTTMLKGAETLASLTYAYNKDALLESTTQKNLPGAEKPTYSYDENHRLLEGAGIAYAYNPGNSPTTIGASTYTYDKASQLEKGGGVTFAFDSLGDRTKATPSSGPATTYGYDQAGNLISVKRPEEGATPKIEDTYGYDGGGLRVSQTISGVTTHMAWDVMDQLPMLLSDGANSYIYGPGGVPIEQVDGAEKAVYLHHDQQGSTRLLTGATGKKEGAYTYGPYGNTQEHTGTVSTPMGYDGQYTSSDTGLIYLRARAYDPVTAQFLSVDPAVSSTGAPYGYADGDPINAADPSGLRTTGWCGSVTGAVPILSGNVTVCTVSDGQRRAFTLTAGGSVGISREGIRAVWEWGAHRGWTALRKLISVDVAGARQTSNARRVDDLSGWSSTVSGTAGWGITVGWETFLCDNGVEGDTYSLGWSFGGLSWVPSLGWSASGGRSHTWVF